MKNEGSERNSGEKQQSELASCVPGRQLQTNGTDLQHRVEKAILGFGGSKETRRTGFSGDCRKPCSTTSRAVCGRELVKGVRQIPVVSIPPESR
jgi:hypothetical protein